MVLTHSFSILVMMLFQQVYSQKWSQQDAKSRSFPPLSNHILCILLAMGPTPLTWVGCRRVESKPYLTHLPCYSCIFSNFNSPSCIICHCRFYFLSSCLLVEVIVGYSHPFIQKELGLYGSNTLYWIKKVLDPVHPNLPKSFCIIYALNFSSLFLFSLSLFSIRRNA